jgi:hypothetical protein
MAGENYCLVDGKIHDGGCKDCHEYQNCPLYDIDFDDDVDEDERIRTKFGVDVDDFSDD